MRTLFAALLFSMCLYGSPVFAGVGHEHGHDGSHSHGPISSEKAEAKATKKVKNLAESGKIDKSWVNVKAVSVEQKVYSKGPEWVVTFKNDKISDVSKQTLYLFYMLDGHYIAANYTGE